MRYYKLVLVLVMVDICLTTLIAVVYSAVIYIYSTLLSNVILFYEIMDYFVLRFSSIREYLYKMLNYRCHVFLVANCKDVCD